MRSLHSTSNAALRFCLDHGMKHRTAQHMQGSGNKIYQAKPICNCFRLYFNIIGQIKELAGLDLLGQKKIIKGGSNSKLSSISLRGGAL